MTGGPGVTAGPAFLVIKKIRTIKKILLTSNCEFRSMYTKAEYMQIKKLRELAERAKELQPVDKGTSKKNK